MSRTASPSSGKPYGVARVCRIWHAARATLYRHRRPQPAKPPRRRGPSGPMPDAALVERIRAVLCASPFHGEGHRKVWARLRFAGVRTSRRRVLRLMREHALLAPSRVGSPRGSRNHDGTIIPDALDTMWGTDMTTTWTREGQVAVFIAVDHHNAECVGIHAARHGTRFEALEPLRQGVRQHLGAFARGVAAGLRIRHDHGSQYMSAVFQDELAFLGAESSPAFVRVSGDIGGAGHERHYDPSTRSPTFFRRPLECLSNRAGTSYEVDGCQMSPAKGYPMSPDSQGTGRQRLRRAVHPHAEGEPALGADLRHRRAAASGTAGLPRNLQHHLAHPAARIPDTRRRPSGSAFTCGTRRVGSFMVSHQSGPVHAR